MLIVFIDAYPFERASDLQAQLDHELSVRGLEPGFGYSVNLHNELFSGLGPDEIGYFGEWNFACFPDHSKLKLAGFALIEKFPRIFRFWRLFLNKIARVRKFYIPARFSGSFVRKGIYPFVMRKCIDNILEKNDFAFCVADAVRAPLNRKDQVALEDALKTIHAGKKNVLVSLCDLDGLFHEYGTTSKQVAEKIEWLSQTINSLISEYLIRHPSGDIVVLSDHGICDVDRKINLDLSSFASEIASGTLVYFYDSLYLAVWSKDRDCQERFTRFVTDNYGLERISKEERSEKHLSKPIFGDEIFICPEGACFSPNFFGFRTLKAYHGYHPRCTKSHGVLFSNFPARNVKKNTDIYQLLSSRMQ